jgi:hypothetical protein
VCVCPCLSVYQCFVTCHVYCFCGPQEEQLLTGIQIDKNKQTQVRVDSQSEEKEEGDGGERVEG